MPGSTASIASCAPPSISASVSPPWRPAALSPIERSSARHLIRAAAALTLILTLAQAPPLDAQPLDPTATEALAATLKMLLDPAQRSAAIAGNPQAGPIDAQVRALTRSDALTQEFYGLAADVFAELAQATGGDVLKLTEMLDRARVDPGAFAAMLSPETQQRLRKLSTQISDRPR